MGFVTGGASSGTGAECVIGCSFVLVYKAVIWVS